MTLRRLCVLACIAALASCVQGQRGNPPAPGAAPLVERARWIESAGRQFTRISPDGRWLSWLAPHEGVVNLWIAPVASPDDARVLTAERSDRVSSYVWAPDGGSLLFTRDKGGDQNFVIHRIGVAGGTTRALTPERNVRAQIVAVSPQVKDRVLVSLNERDPRWPDLYLLDLASGETRLLLRNDGYASVVADRQLQVRLALKARGDGGSDVHAVESGRVASAPSETIPFEDVRTTAPLGYSADGRTLYWRDSRGRDTAALVAQDTRSGAKTVLGAHPRADVVATTAPAATGAIDGYEVNPLRSEWTGLTDRARRDFARLARLLDGELEIVARSDADDRWVVLLKPGDRPPTTYLYDRGSGRATALTDRDAPAFAPTGATHAVSIRGRDGLVHAAYLTLPSGSDADHDGRPDRPLPLVVVVHGGPWERADFAYQPTSAFLANRGYAVLSPNFRASTGFGKAYLAAGDGEYGGRMQDDLVDAAEWAVSEGVAVREKIAIYGGSYGGYAVLAALAFTPRQFACGVDLFGTTDLRMQVENDAARRESRRAEYYRRMGDPTTEAGRALLAARSPLMHADAIGRPLLVAQGSNDPQVRQVQSDRLVEALKARDATVTYLVFPDEGHGFTKPRNVTALRAVTEHFLARCLGGRAEPFGDSVRTSSAVVAHGAQFIDGLAEAVGR